MNSFFPITRRLVELPDAELPATLWPRIAAAYAARRRLRRHAAFGVSGALAAGIALWCAAPMHTFVPDPTFALQERSHELELELAELSGRDVLPALVTEAELRDVEARLQDAYDRGAGNNELAPLWQRRVDLLGVLLQQQRDGALVSRI